MIDQTTDQLRVARLIIAVFVAAFAICGLSTELAAQGQNQSSNDSNNNSRKDPESSIAEMLAKQQIIRRKKEYEELLKRGEEALKLSEDLENSFADGPSLTSQDIQKLQTLEKVASKIRNELGGNDEGEEDSNSAENEARQTFSSAFKALRTTTQKLVDELKRITRFSVSVIAIQTSNSVIRLARFLRIRK